MVQDRHYALAREEIIAALTSYTGITTADGATPVFNTLVDANLKNKNDFISGKTVLIGSGDALYEDKGAASFDNTDGTITVESPFSARIKAGTVFRILNVPTGQLAELLDSLVSYRGTTTADGAAGGGTLVCSDLTTKPDFDGNQVVIKSGPYAGQVRDIDGNTRLLGGTVTPHISFGGTITEGTSFSITAIRTVPAEVAGLETLVTKLQGLVYYGVVTDVPPFANTFTIPTLAGMGTGKFTNVGGLSYSAFVFRDASGPGGAPQGEYQTITAYDSGGGTFTTNAFTAPVGIGDEILIIHPFLAKIMNSAGLPPHVGTTPGAWQTAEADIVSLGAANVRYKLHSLLLDINNLAGTVTIRMYLDLVGNVRRVYQQAFTVAADGPGLWIVNGTVGIHEVLRVTAQSDAAADNTKAIGYDYMLEEM